MSRNPNPDPEIFELTSTTGATRPAGAPASINAHAPGWHAPHRQSEGLNRGAYHIWTIGCQMNVADSNHVAAELERIGYHPTDKVDDADIVVLNTCVVRQSAEDKGAGKAGSLKPWRHKRAGRTLALMGCMVGIKPGRQLRERFPHVDVFMPPSEPAPLISYLREEEIAAESARFEEEALAQRHAFQDGESRYNGGQSIQHLALSGEGTVSAHVPVVYGCSHACTFCIIPFRRGIERSRHSLGFFPAEPPRIIERGFAFAAGFVDRRLDDVEINTHLRQQLPAARR